MFKSYSLHKMVQSFIIIHSSYHTYHYGQLWIATAGWLPSLNIHTDAVGYQSDAGKFRTSSIHKLPERRELNTPSDWRLPGSVSKMSFLSLQDEGYLILPCLMAWNSATNLDDAKLVFNSKLSRAEKSGECALGTTCFIQHILLKCVKIVEHNAT